MFVAFMLTIYITCTTSAIDVSAAGVSVVMNGTTLETGYYHYEYDSNGVLVLIHDAENAPAAVSPRSAPAPSGRTSANWSRRRSAALSVHDFYGTFCPCCRLQILTISLHQEDSLKYYSKHFHLLQPLFPLTSKSAVLRTVQFSICSQPLSRSCSPYERKNAQFAP